MKKGQLLGLERKKKGGDPPLSRGGGGKRGTRFSSLALQGRPSQRKGRQKGKRRKRKEGKDGSLSRGREGKNTQPALKRRLHTVHTKKKKEGKKGPFLLPL